MGTVARISNKTLVRGQLFNIIGSGFSSIPQNLKVLVAGVEATVEAASDTMIMARVPKIENKGS
jgi:hypothetical protein